MEEHGQQLYDLLYSINKIFKEKDVLLPTQGTQYFNCQSKDKAYNFKVMVRISKNVPGKFEIVKLYENTRIFALDIQGRPHRNADGNLTTPDHIHIFERNELAAYSMTEFHETFFKNNQDLFELFSEMCDYLNIEFQKTKQMHLFN